MSKLLFDESPLVIQPSLAVKIGLNEAIFLQQLHYWIQKSKNIKNGLKWSYNNYDELQKQFPFWSIRTIKTIVKNLKDGGLLWVENHTENKWDKTNWYSINYDELNGTIDSAESVVIDSVDVAPSEGKELHPQYSKIKETSTETSTETKNIIQKVTEFLNLKAKTNFKHSTPKTQSLIQARLNEGFTYDDFVIVINKKTDQWLNDAKMSGYIRPETLFGTKFEGYLNEKVGKDTFDLSGTDYSHEERF